MKEWFKKYFFFSPEWEDYKCVFVSYLTPAVQVEQAVAESVWWTGHKAQKMHKIMFSLFTIYFERILRWKIAALSYVT